MKKTIMPNPVKSLGHIKCYSSSIPRPVKSLVIRSDTTVRRFAVGWEDPKPYWKSEKGHTSLGDQKSYYLQVCQRPYNRKKINR